MLVCGRVPYNKRRRTPSDPEGSSGSQVSYVLWSTRLFFVLLKKSVPAKPSAARVFFSLARSRKTIVRM